MNGRKSYMNAIFNGLNAQNQDIMILLAKSIHLAQQAVGLDSLDLHTDSCYEINMIKNFMNKHQGEECTMLKNKTLTSLEYEAVLDKEREIQAKQQIQADLDQSASVIHTLKETIRRITNCAPETLLFFDLLERERWQSNALEAYAAGREARAKGMDPDAGVDAFIRDWMKRDEIQNQAKALEQALQKLHSLMPPDLEEDYVKALLDAYRESYPNLAARADIFFRMGYHANEEAGEIGALLMDGEEAFEARRKPAKSGV